VILSSVGTLRDYVRCSRLHLNLPSARTKQSLIGRERNKQAREIWKLQCLAECCQLVGMSAV